MAGPSGGKGAKIGSSGHASNAALHDDEDVMDRRRALFGKWKQSKRPKHMIDYINSPTPPMPKVTR